MIVKYPQGRIGSIYKDGEWKELNRDKKNKKILKNKEKEKENSDLIGDID